MSILATDSIQMSSKENAHPNNECDGIEDDSLNNFPSQDEYIDKSKTEWHMPTYSILPSSAEIKNQMPPLIEEIDFSKCKTNLNSKSLKRRSLRVDAQTINRKSSASLDKFSLNNSHNPKSAISKQGESNSKSNGSNSNLRESNFLHDIDSDDDQYGSCYSYYDEDDDNSHTNNAVINLPPPLEIGMEMPSVPEPDIFDMFEFQLPSMPNPSESDAKYIQEIDLRFDREKLLQELKSH